MRTVFVITLWAICAHYGLPLGMAALGTFVVITEWMMFSNPIIQTDEENSIEDHRNSS